MGFAMRLFHWLSGNFSQRGKALSRYRRGMRHARMHAHSQAIDDYTAVINTSNVPRDVRAMALYNRALVHAAAGDELTATDDLRAVLATDASPESVRNAARQKLQRMSRQHREGV
jgi:hypothetical protein